MRIEKQRPRLAADDVEALAIALAMRATKVLAGSLRAKRPDEIMQTWHLRNQLAADRGRTARRAAQFFLRHVEGLSTEADPRCWGFRHAP